MQEAIQKPFNAGRAVGRERLMRLLRALMIRAAKSDIRSIPPCHRQVPAQFMGPSGLGSAVLVHFNRDPVRGSASMKKW